MNDDLISNNSESNVVIYRTEDDSLQLDVQLADETVWLTQQQMSELFQKDRSVITRHINNIFKDGELEEKSNVQNLHIPFSDKPVKVYNLDVIISVGYRVKSLRGTQFRRWANSVLKEYLLKGYAVNQQLMYIEQRIDNRLMDHEKRLEEVESKVNFFVQTSLPPHEGVLLDGQVFDAYELASKMIKSATKSIVLFDNYIDETVLTLLDKRAVGVAATIYTNHIDRQLQLDINRHNSQYPSIDVQIFNRSHDRFLCIDDTVYHLGASLKDLGKKWFAFNRMVLTKDELLSKM